MDQQQIPEQEKGRPTAEVLGLVKQYLEGANWFYWVAGLSLFSSILMALGSKFISALTLGITEILTAQAIIKPELTVTVAIPILLLVGVMAGLGYLSSKGKSWAYLLGIILYCLDLIVLWSFVPDIISTIFHGIALFFMIRGYAALCKLKTLLGPKSDAGDGPIVR